MFLEKIKSEGIAHLSYIIGDGLHAAVIDPRRDCEIYRQIASREGVQITHIFETHRNEDYVIGSLDLARHTGAGIYHGKALDFGYGTPVSDGEKFSIGDLRLTVFETPGHTFESISIVVADSNYGKEAVAVFTGDALFIGDVGRTDFFPDRARETSGALYDSIFKKLLLLGDQTILLPAHGAGSVCGSSMASREFSTIGYERQYNPVLQKIKRDEFIEYKMSEHHYQPPYFRMMEKYNQQGPPPLETVPRPKPLSSGAVAEAKEGGAVLLDLRSPEAFAGAFIPDSIAMPASMVPAYAGYLLGYDQDLVLIAESDEQVETATLHLIRIGYDRIVGHLKGGMHAWETSGRQYDRIGAVHAGTLQKRLRERDDFTLLDVRQIDEVKQGRLEGATHIFLGELVERLDEIDRDKPVVTFCGSGQRAIIAASILKGHGFEQVEDSLGSMQACRSIGCEIIE